MQRSSRHARLEVAAPAARGAARVAPSSHATQLKKERLEESIGDAARAVKRVEQELKSTARHFLAEQARDRQLIRQIDQRLRDAETRIAELGLTGVSGGTLAIEGKNHGASVDVLKPLIHSLVAETMGRQGDLFAEVIDQLTTEVRRIEQMFDERVEQNYEALQKLRRQVESMQHHTTSVSAQAESALRAVEDLRVDSLDVLQAMQTSVAARAPSQTELDDVRSRVERLDAKIDSVDVKVERVDAKTERVRGQHGAAAGHGLVLEKEVVSMLQRQIESLQADLKAGEQRLAEVDVKCVAALDGAARNRKAAKKLEAKVDGAQERLDTRLDRLAAQAMQRPPPPEEMAESVPPPVLGAFSDGTGDSRMSIGLATPSVLSGRAGISAAGATGARGRRGGAVWEEHSAVDGQLYYYNTQTRQTTWTRPVELSHASTATQPLPETAEDTVRGGTAARVAALEQVVVEERNQVCLHVPIHLTVSESLRITCMSVSLRFSNIEIVLCAGVLLSAADADERRPAGGAQKAEATKSKG